MGKPEARSIGNPELLRRDADAGEAPDKVRFPDPAAAPLGTGDEAGGHPETAREVKQAIRTETKPVVNAYRLGQDERDEGRWQRIALLLVYEVPAIVIAILVYFAAR